MAIALLRSSRSFLEPPAAALQWKLAVGRGFLTSLSPERLPYCKRIGNTAQSWRRACYIADGGDKGRALHNERIGNVQSGVDQAYDPQASQDMRFMTAALKHAEQAAVEGEVPVGAVLVHDGEIIAGGYNQVEAANDPTAHAEMLVIRQAAKQQGGRWHLRDATLYVTLEPCAMCAGAILLSRVGTVVYGARNSLLGADGSWTSLFPVSSPGDEDGSEAAGWPGKPHPTHPELQVRRGVKAAECGSIMQQFFQRRRQENKLKEEKDKGIGVQSAAKQSL